MGVPSGFESLLSQSSINDAALQWGNYGGQATAGAGGLMSALGAAGSALGPVGAALGGLGSLASGLTGLLSMGRQSQASKMEQQRWENVREPVGNLYRQMFYNPVLEGTFAPYGTWSENENYTYAPTQAMRNIYSGYLTRQYGLPESIARAQSSQAMGPLRLGQIPSTLRSPAQVGSGLSQHQGYDPSVVAQSILSSRTPEIQRQLDYLQSAAELAGFNLWRSQYLPQLIG